MRLPVIGAAGITKGKRAYCSGSKNRPLILLAGDMTIYGKRDNVKILREMTDGTYEVHELDMRDANILNSPYYHLQQRDVVYVEPNEAMAQNAKLGVRPNCGYVVPLLLFR